MGVCPSLNPQKRLLKHKNQLIINFLLNQIKDFTVYNFYKPLYKTIKSLPSRYLLSEGIIEDIQKLHFYANKSLIETGTSRITEFISHQTLEEEIKTSCLILENQAMSEIQSQLNQYNPMDFQGSNSFHNNMSKNESLVAQMHLIYGKEINRDEYSQSLKLFMKWIQYFNEHSYGGFLKPLYRAFCQSLLTLENSDFDTMIDELSVFTQFMVKVYTEVYKLKILNTSRNGKLFKNQNLYNLIMSFMFKKTKIRPFIRSMIRVNEMSKIRKFEQKIKILHNRGIQTFGVDPKFILIKSYHESQIKVFKKNNQPKQYNQKQQKTNEVQIQNKPGNYNDKNYQSYLSFKSKIDSECYQQSLKLVSELSLCCDLHTPISKLKILISISKKIVQEIQEFYSREFETSSSQIRIPEMDPDNLSGIVMYLICRNNNSNIYEELKIIEYFTTTNTLNSISGYYLNLFLATCEMIIQQK